MKTLITYRKNPDYSNMPGDNPRLFASLDLSAYGVETTVEKLPIFYYQLDEPVGPVRVTYSTHVAGLPVEAGNLQRLEEAIDGLVRTLIRFERLPEYLFTVQENAWPIYELHGELLTRYPGGPVFNAPDIAALRVWLADHFKGTGRIRNRREMGILYLSPYNFQLYAPYCVLRATDDEVADIPIFPAPHAGGLNLLAPLDGKSLTAPFTGGLGIFRLQAAAGQALVETGRLEEGRELTIRKLDLEDWLSIVTALKQTPHHLTYARKRERGLQRYNLPVYRLENKMIAARPNRVQHVVLYTAPELAALAYRVGQDLHRYGSTASPHDVRAILDRTAAGETKTSRVSLLDETLGKPVFERQAA